MEKSKRRDWREKNTQQKARLERKPRSQDIREKEKKIPKKGGSKPSNGRGNANVNKQKVQKGNKVEKGKQKSKNGHKEHVIKKKVQAD